MAWVLAGALACTAGASAQTPPPPTPPAAAPAPPPADETEGDSVVVSELVVNAPLLGPALWKVARGDSEVVVLGGLTPLPHIQTWNTGRIEHALSESGELLVPPTGRLTALQAAGFAVRALQVRQPLGRTLEPSLPPPLRARFAAERESLGLGPGAYAHWKPAAAGFLLIGDARRKLGLSNEKPASTVVHLAEARHVRVQRVASYHLGELFGSLTRLSNDQQLACLSDELDAIDFEKAHSKAAAEAWSHGDLSAARAGSSGPILDRCAALLSNYGAVVERGTADFTSEIDDALKKPGKAVAVIDLRYLLRANGVLDRLKAQGATITVPKE
ncbi:MAG TPA: TraB/GumN family protein [Caulobacteraceae bacterium]|nr:TraB/GumN family protein [Caulobacteraceae bacterium]